jgi:NSS family neurotransmitter:Na+ symporter
MAGERWSSGSGFVLATMGSAIGLGSIWKFPYEAGANGGGSFVVPYLLGLAIIVVPLVLAEFAIGRAGRSDAVESMKRVAVAARRSPAWRAVGGLGIVTGFLILSFYAVIGGWALAYSFDSLLSGGGDASAAVAQGRFDALLASPFRILGFHFAFMAATALVVAAGIETGIEAASRVLMPVLFVMIAALACYSLVVGDAPAALRFLFAMDATRWHPRAWLDAVGLGFFSIGVGLGSMITYAAYAGAEVNLRKVAVITVVGDTTVSFLAGLAIFPLVFKYGLDPAGGPGLMFVTLPVAFAQMPFGGVLGFAFYLLLVISALASAISLLELSVAWLMARGMSRPRGAALAGVACGLSGVPTVLSFNRWAEWHPLADWPGFARSTVFQLLDFATSDVLLPLGGLGIALFAGWFMPRHLIGRELGLSGAGLLTLILALRFVVPGLIVVAVLAPWIL